MEEVNKKILLVEDDPNFGTVLRDYLMMEISSGLRRFLSKLSSKGLRFLT